MTPLSRIDTVSRKIMSRNIIIMTLALLVVKPSFAIEKPLNIKQALNNESIQKSIFNEPYVSSRVSTTTFQGKEGQAMDFWAAGLHPKSCRVALRRLSRYEDYKNYLGFLEESLYFEDLQLISFRISTPLFPIKFGLRFKIPRVDKEGVYPFHFQEGFLKNLKGKIHISEEQGRCFFYIKSEWQGPYSGFSNMVLEIFSKTIIKLGAEKLFRVSSF